MLSGLIVEMSTERKSLVIRTGEASTSVKEESDSPLANNARGMREIVSLIFLRIGIVLTLLK